ncbi:unnamed protein product [Trichobilharzia regenti]|nr:unnamed protein product [Trichobilharzia regenti]
MLDPKRTIFFMCDVQKSLLNVVLDSENVTLRISNLYSKGLGNTVNNLDISHALCVVDKKTFSMYPGLIADKMKEFRDYVVVLFGLEVSFKIVIIFH